MHAYDSVMRGYFCIGFKDLILDNKSLESFTNLFSLLKKCSFPLRISSVNVTKSAVCCRFDQIN